MKRAHRTGWIALAFITVLLAITPDVVTLPQPEGVLRLDHAELETSAASRNRISLPHTVFPKVAPESNLVRYRIAFELPASVGKNLFLYIPTVNRQIAINFNGEDLLDLDVGRIWYGPAISDTIMVRLPNDKTRPGLNQLTITMDKSHFVFPTYVSELYIGPKAKLSSAFSVRTFLHYQLKTVFLAAHLLIGLGLVVACFFRPKDPLFVWLALFIVSSFIVTIGQFFGWHSALGRSIHFTSAFAPSTGLLLLGVATTLIHLQPPKILAQLTVILPLILLPLAAVGTTTFTLILAIIVWSILIASNIAATGLLAWSAFLKKNTDARLMIAPLSLMAWSNLHDTFVVATLPHHGFNLLIAYPRPVFLVFLMALLMRRMGLSLNQFDQANETLAIKLSERESELAALYDQDQIEQSRRVREQERQRLTRDLHDGISGHLVSIIALSERSGASPIEQTARAALNDLRLVIYSLDLGDRDLPLALANFRDRLIPQLQRLGVNLDWSIARLPEVSGVTPGNALSILRILQEAITNAIKHGPARHIKIMGTAHADGMACITVENDGRPFVESHSGLGLQNMRRRAETLGGSLTVASVREGTVVTLLLPSTLPDLG